jgi:hypothetical protein
VSFGDAIEPLVLEALVVITIDCSVELELDEKLLKPVVVEVAVEDAIE